MSFAFLLLLPILLSGYIFLTKAYYYRYRTMRVEGYHLYLQAAKFGTYLFASAFLTYAVLHLLAFECMLDVIRACKQYFNSRFASPEHPAFDLIIISGISISLGYLCSLLKNKRMPEEMAYIKAIENDDFELLLYRAMAGDKLIMVTMSHGKVYVGWVVRTFDPCDERKYLRILPFVSGYRKEETLKVKFTTLYQTVIDFITSNNVNDEETEGLQEEDFELVLSVSEIQSANIFDLIAYLKFQSQVDEGRSNNQGHSKDSASD